MKVLGIETSCDDTAVAVVEDGHRVLSSIVSSQVALHRAYGGVVPELASRHHLRNLRPILDQALGEAGSGVATSAPNLDGIDGIAVTAGPGLIGSLLVGVSFAKALAWSTGKPLVAVNHLEGHVRAAFIENPHLPLPALALIVSGGHTSLYLCQEAGTYRLLARTRDDAAGEAFDKAARMLGLGYPGGPIIDRLAKEGDAEAVPFPRAKMSDGSLDFSFSGLKTALLRYAQAQGLAIERRAPSGAYDPHGTDRGPAEEGEIEPSKAIRDIAASFQRAVVSVLVERTMAAAQEEGAVSVIVSGGVACNSLLRDEIRAACAARGLTAAIPAPRYCTDNAAMIAAAGALKLQRGERAPLDLTAMPGWKLGGPESARTSSRHK